MNHWDTVKNVRGIYKVTNKINGKVYIGQSVDIGRRWRQHMTAEDDSYFHKAIQKYGVENFEWEVIEQCKKKDLDEREVYWIEYYDSFNKGYNRTKGGDGVSGGEDHPRWKGGVSSDPEYSKQYYQANKEQKKQYSKQHYKQYYEENKEKVKEYKEANKEKKKEYDKQYYKQYYAVNKEKKKEYDKQYYEENKEKRKQYRKEYYEANKEKRKEYNRQRNKKIKNILSYFYYIIK